jgi:hypothetical protein
LIEVMALLKTAKVGTWLELGSFGNRKRAWPLVWRVAGKLGKTPWLITAGVVAQVPFDRPSKQHPDGDNRWRDSSLRKWLGKDFLTGFAAADRARLVEVERQTEVTSGYSALRKPGSDVTQDRVWVPSWEEYKRLPAALRGGERALSFLKDYPDEILEKQLHWSRTPLDGLGVALFEHWEREKRHTNSGASQEFAIRPCIALAGDTPVTGAGTAKDPLRPA